MPENWWAGTSVGDKKGFWRFDELAKVDAKIRWVSIEPLIEPVSAELDAVLAEGFIDWVVLGGESGSKCRPFPLDDAYKIRDLCAKHNVKFFMKQMGGKRKPFAPIPADLFIREFPDSEKKHDCV